MRLLNAVTTWPLAFTVVTGLTIPGTDSADSELQHDNHKRDETRLDEYMTTYASEDILPTSKTVSVSTSKLATGTAVVAPPLSAVDPDLEPHTEGFVITTVDNPAETQPPLLTSSIPSPTKLLQPIKSLVSSSEESEAAQETEEPEVSGDPDDSGLVKRATNMFAAAIDTSAPPSMFKRVSDHPVPRKGIGKKGPLQTNKFYTNLFMGNQTSPVFTFPYSLAWAAGTGPAASWGMAISHIDASKRVFGPVEYNNAAKYYLNPIAIQSMIISATELGKNTVLTTDSGTQLYVKAALRKDKNSSPSIIFPITQGMVFTTAYFSGSTPMIQSGVFFRSMTRVSKDPKTNVRKYNFVLEDGTTWRLYAYKTSGDPLDLQLTNNGLAQSKKRFTGYIQIAKDNNMSKSQAVLDNGCGVFPNGVDIQGSVSGTQGSYTLKFTRAGHSSGNLFMFALPHHVSSFDANTRKNIKDYQLQTTTKGLATAVVGNSWTMVESSLPVDMGFAPRHLTLGNRGLSTAAKNAIKPVAQSEVSQDMEAQTNLNSMYFSGKVSKLFSLFFIAHETDAE
jgi:endo-1,3(4)-beta-glucanase